jgi:hypothetical protein
MKDGGSMSENKEKNHEVQVVGASGAIGILPGGFFAKILSDPPETKSSGPASSQESSKHS